MSHTAPKKAVKKAPLPVRSVMTRIARSDLNNDVTHLVPKVDNGDDDYGKTTVKDTMIKGKWRNVSMLSNTQLADTNALAGLVCIQVCDEAEVLADIAAKKSAKKAVSKKPAELVSPTQDIDEFKPLELSVNVKKGKKHAIVEKTDKPAPLTETPPKNPTIAIPDPKKKQKPIKQELNPTKQQKLNKIKNSVKVVQNTPIEPEIVTDSEFQWFDDLSDDESIQKRKKVERKAALQAKMNQELYEAKLALKRAKDVSIVEEFDEYIDEDDEFETIEVISDDDGESMLDRFKKAKNVEMSDVYDGTTEISDNLAFLSSLVSKDDENSVSSIESEDYQDINNSFSGIQSGDKNTEKLPPYKQKIASHMLSLQEYLDQSIVDIEESHEEDLSSQQYYQSQNATLFYYHTDYLSWLPYDLHPLIQLSLIREKFTSPRPIQAETLLPALRDYKDIVGVAQTGSGKTLSFVLPILQHVISERDVRGEYDTIWKDRQMALTQQDLQGKHYKDNLSAIILSPTRELAMQIKDQVLLFGALAQVKPTLIVGGIFLDKQIRLIQQHSPIIIATPGRLWDVMKQFNSPIDFTFLRFLVLDEADRMVASGHFKELNEIIDYIHMSINKRTDETQQVRDFLIEQKRNLVELLREQQAENERPKLDVIDQTAEDAEAEEEFKLKVKNLKKRKIVEAEPLYPVKKLKKAPNVKKQPKKRVKIDYGPQFVDADSFDLDKYLANIERQRRGEAPTAKSTKSDDDDDGDDEVDYDEDMEFFNDINENDELDMDEDDEYSVFQPNDYFEDESEDAELTEEQLVQLEQQQAQTEEEMRLQDQKFKSSLVEKFQAFTNKIPTKLQVFLYSATLMLQDEAREAEAKRNKIGARELSFKQGKIHQKASFFGEEADQQSQEDIDKRKEYGKARLIELSQRLTLTAPYIIDLSSQLILPPTLQQYAVEISETDTRDAMLYGLLYEKRDITAIVFVNSVNLTRKVADYLRVLGINSYALHSETDQKGRIKVLEKFRADCARINQWKEKQKEKVQQDTEDGFTMELEARGLSQAYYHQQAQNASKKKNTPKAQNINKLSLDNPLGNGTTKYGSVLVCTDIVARGLDIPMLDVVIHYHIPFDAETYIHRCGRTARGLASGKSVVICSPQEDKQWRVIQHQLHVGLGRDEADGLAKAGRQAFTPASASDVKKITMNSKFIVHLNDRLSYAKKLATTGVDEKVEKKQKFYESKVKSALGYVDDDDDMWTSKKEKERLKSDNEGILAHERNKQKRDLKNAEVTLQRLLRTKIHTQGGYFNW